MPLFRRRSRETAPRSRAPTAEPAGVAWQRPGPSDPGVQVVELVYRNMQIDEEWSLRQERGFCWWGHEYAQRIWAEPGYDDDGIVIYRLNAEADVVRDI